MSRMGETVGARIRELAESMKAERATTALPRYAGADSGEGYARADWEARLMAKYRDTPVKLSDEALAKLKGAGPG